MTYNRDMQHVAVLHNVATITPTHLHHLVDSEPFRKAAVQEPQLDVMLVTEGCLLLDYPEMPVCVGAGDVCIRGPHQSCDIHTDRAISFYHCSFYCPGGQIEVLRENLHTWAREIYFATDPLRHTHSLFLPDVLHLEARVQAEALLAQITLEQTLCIPGSAVAIQAAFLRFLHLVSQEVIATLMRDAPQDGRSVNHHIRHAVEFIEANLSHPLTPRYIAEQLDLNVDYLGRLFQQVLRESIGEYLLHRRLTAARELLTSTSLNVKQVAYQVGITDPLYFSRLFRREEGCSPCQFQRQHRSAMQFQPEKRERQKTMLLNGAWECAIDDGVEGTPLIWMPVQVPGWLLPITEPVDNVKYVRVQRTFSINKAQVGSLAVLHWNQINWGAVVLINGQQVGQHATTGPYQVMLPPGTLCEGENTIMLHVCGAAGVARAQRGHMLIPAGLANYATVPNGVPQIGDDVWIDFADTAYLKWVLAMPDLARSVVRLRVTPAGHEAMAGLMLTVTVCPWPEGDVLGRTEVPAAVLPDADPLGVAGTYLVEVPMPDYKPWTYETPNLYTAAVKLSRGRQVLDEVQIRFGMREITVEHGHYRLNGKPLWLHGAELVGDWKWSPGIPGHEVNFLVTEAREMSMNALRPHAQPPPAKWADICDEHGTMLLAEFPVLYNDADFHFTPEEYRIWHMHVLDDAAGWIGYLWNHPSVVMWVASSASNHDHAWEQGPYDDFIRALDPTRPTMRSGQRSPQTGTHDNIDWRPNSNLSDPEEGCFQLQLQDWLNKRDWRTMSASEYMSIFDWTQQREWTEARDMTTNFLAMTQLGMEHTEALRRARLDAILPNTYAGWTKTRMGQEWKSCFASSASACWHSALSPVLASLDLFDPDYVTGQRVTTDLYLLNDSWHEAKIHVDVLITREDPEFIPEAACFDAPVAKWRFDFTLPADSVQIMPVTWTLPAEEGSYWLTARTTGIPGRPVLSQRFIRAVQPPNAPAGVKARTIMLLGGDAEATAFFQSHGLHITHSTTGLTPARHLVVIWDAGRLSEDEKGQAGAFCDFAAAGGRIVVLGGNEWTWPALCEVLLDGNCHGSRVFSYENLPCPWLAGISHDMLSRWNGVPGTVAMGVLHEKTGKPLAEMQGATGLGWVIQREFPAIAEVPAAVGNGVILFALLAWRSHLDRTKPTYDPVAERVLWTLLR